VISESTRKISETAGSPDDCEATEAAIAAALNRCLNSDARTMSGSVCASHPCDTVGHAAQRSRGFRWGPVLLQAVQSAIDIRPRRLLAVPRRFAENRLYMA